MNLFTLSSLIVSFASAFIGIFTLLKSEKNALTIIFTLYAFAVVGWGWSGYRFSITTSEENAFFWWQIAYIFVITIPVFHYHFLYYFLKLDTKQHKFALFIGYLLASIFIAINLSNRQIFLGNLRFVFNQVYWHDWVANKNLLYLLFYISIYWLFTGYTFLVLIDKYKNSRGIFRTQMKYILPSSAIAWLGAELCFLPDYHIDVYPYANFLIAIYPFTIAYVIIRYRLMDIRVVITRASAFIAVYTVVLGIPFILAARFKSYLIDIFGSSWWIAPLGLMAALATVGPFIYIYISRRAEERLLREQKDYQNTLKQASVGMTRIRNLKKLLGLITHIVTKTVKISYAAIYLFDREKDEYTLQVSRDNGKISLSKLSSDNPLVTWLMVKREPMVYEEIKRQMEDNTNVTYKFLEENMRHLNAAVIIPSFLEDKIMGFIVLGEKISGQIYTPDDLNVFQVLASQAALAIENAQFYEEAKEMQDQIAQAEKMATIGTMADGLSHQINNRFYALSLIAGDSIDTIKMTDTSKCTPEVREMIESINHALERIQVNVMQGGEVVKGILKYTRKGEEKFEDLTMDQIIDGTLEMVQFKVRLSEIDIVRDYAKDGPKIRGNLTQLQECFFNFIDNAYDAINERKAEMKEEGYRGRIVFSTIPKGEYIEITVEDNGLGVKEENIRKVFTPFFTTKISARKGTGLGLYVINKIITDAHKGRIAFESEHGIGTRFILELPIAK